MELEEKLRSMEAERPPFGGKAGGDGSADKNQKGPRGRWLARLGLKDGD